MSIIPVAYIFKISRVISSILCFLFPSLKKITADAIERSIIERNDEDLEEIVKRNIAYNIFQWLITTSMHRYSDVKFKKLFDTDDFNDAIKKNKHCIALVSPVHFFPGILISLLYEIFSNNKVQLFSTYSFSEKSFLFRSEVDNYKKRFKWDYHHLLNVKNSKKADWEIFQDEVQKAKNTMMVFGDINLKRRDNDFSFQIGKGTFHVNNALNYCMNNVSEKKLMIAPYLVYLNGRFKLLYDLIEIKEARDKYYKEILPDQIIRHYDQWTLWWSAPVMLE